MLSMTHTATTKPPAPLALDLIGQHGSWSPWQPWPAARRMETSATEPPEPHPPPANLLISQVYLWVPGGPLPWTERDSAVASNPLTLKALKSYCLFSSLILCSTSPLVSDGFALEFVWTGKRTLRCRSASKSRPISKSDMHSPHLLQLTFYCDYKWS